MKNCRVHECMLKRFLHSTWLSSVCRHFSVTEEKLADCIAYVKFTTIQPTTSLLSA